MSTHRFENDIEERLRADAERMRHLAKSLPAACVEQSRERLQTALQACESRPPLPNRLWDGLTRLHPATLGGLAAALAALALGAVCLCESLRREPSPSTPSDAAEHAVAAVVGPDSTLLAPVTATTIADPTAAVPETSVANAPDQSPGESLAALRAEFERLKASATGVGNAYLIRLVNHLVSVKDTASEDYEGLRLLLVETYEQLGERDRALNAYVRYLDVVEQRGGRDRAALLVWRRAQEIFQERGERLESLGYYDLVLTRYPGTGMAREARLMPAQYLELAGTWSAAAEAYGRAVRDEEDGPARRRAMRRQSTMLFNAQDYEGSVRVLQEALAEALPPREEAETRFVLGCRYYFRGLASHPAAMQEFRRVLDLKTAHLSDAERMLARIRSTAVAEGFGDILLN